MHGCLKTFLILNAGMVVLVSGCILVYKIKTYKAKSNSPTGRYMATWYGNGESVSAYIIDTQRKKWSRPLWNFTEDWAILDESHLTVDEYKCFWKNDKVCIFIAEGRTPFLGKEVHVRKCNVETMACAYTTPEEGKALQTSHTKNQGLLKPH